MKVKNLILGIGIVVVFALALWQGVEAFYPSHEYSDFCEEFKTTEFIDSAERCEAVGGKWTEDGIPRVPKIEGQQEITGYCDRDFTCRQEWDDARDKRAGIIFIISVVVGLIVLVVGYFFLAVEPVGSALIASGIWSFFFGSVVNWRNFSDIWRFLLLLLALILIIWLAVRTNRPKKSKKKR